MTQNSHGGSWLYRAGCRVSAWASDVSAHPFAQISFIIVCAIWFAVGFATELLTAILSILAITLTQMVLNRQNDREADAHRRDVAMHAKVDELVVAMKGARNEMAGIEEDLDEEEIEELKNHARQATEVLADEEATSEEKAAAHRKAADAHEKIARATKRVVSAKS